MDKQKLVGDASSLRPVRAMCDVKRKFLQQEWYEPYIPLEIAK